MINEEFELTHEQKQRKIDMLRSMKKEIEILDYQKRHYKLVNLEAHFLRLSRLFLHYVKKISPYLATLAATYFLFKSIHVTPFIQDETDKKERIKKEFDSNGNVRYEIQFDDFAQKVNVIQVFSKWTKSNSNYYTRTINVYDVQKIKIDKIKDIVSKNDLTIDNLFDSPTLVKTEKKNNLSEEEINMEPFVQGITYSSSKNEILVVKESDAFNIGTTLAWLVLNAILFRFIMIFRKEEKESLFDYVKHLTDEYPIVDPDELEKIVTLKKSNYDRLTR